MRIVAAIAEHETRPEPYRGSGEIRSTFFDPTALVGEAWAVGRALFIRGVARASAKGVASAASGARGGASATINTLDDIIANPHLLQGKAPGQLVDAIENSPNWVQGTMRRSQSRPGEGVTLREVNEAGNLTGKYIQWHPGGGHHGKNPYWKVSSGQGGIVRVDPCR